MTIDPTNNAQIIRAYPQCPGRVGESQGILFTMPRNATERVNGALSASCDGRTWVSHQTYMPGSRFSRQRCSPTGRWAFWARRYSVLHHSDGVVEFPCPLASLSGGRLEITSGISPARSESSLGSLHGGASSRPLVCRTQETSADQGRRAAGP